LQYTIEHHPKTAKVFAEKILATCDRVINNTHFESKDYKDASQLHSQIDFIHKQIQDTIN